MESSLDRVNLGARSRHPQRARENSGESPQAGIQDGVRLFVPSIGPDAENWRVYGESKQGGRMKLVSQCDPPPCRIEFEAPSGHWFRFH